MQYSQSKLIINLKNITNNLSVVKKFCKNSITSAVIKANAYGLGDVAIAKHLIKKKCNHFWVANILEALRIKKKISKINLYVLNGLNIGEENVFYKNKLVPVINNYEQFKRWTNYLTKKKSFNKIIIQFDTGMCRSGIQESEMTKLLKDRVILDKFKEVILMSHLACADNKNDKYNKIQLEKFNKIKSLFPGYKYSLAASGGIFLGKNYHMDIIRPGIALYGGRLRFNKKLKNVASLISPIIQINKLKKGESAGYSRTFIAKKNTTTATIPLGYADGIKIRISNLGHVFFDGIKLPMIGRVSMDLMIIDVTRVEKKIKVGDFLEIFGKHQNIDKFAEIAQTLPYNILTSVSERCDRIYLN